MNVSEVAMTFHDLRGNTPSFGHVQIWLHFPFTTERVTHDYAVPAAEGKLGLL